MNKKIMSLFFAMLLMAAFVACSDDNGGGGSTESTDNSESSADTSAGPSPYPDTFVPKAADDGKVIITYVSTGGTSGNGWAVAGSGFVSNKFIELRNIGTTPVDISTWNLCFSYDTTDGSTTGGGIRIVSLAPTPYSDATINQTGTTGEYTGTIPGGKSFLVAHVGSTPFSKDGYEVKADLFSAHKTAATTAATLDATWGQGGTGIALVKKAQAWDGSDMVALSDEAIASVFAFNAGGSPRYGYFFEGTRCVGASNTEVNWARKLTSDGTSYEITGNNANDFELFATSSAARPPRNLVHSGVAAE